VSFLLRFSAASSQQKRVAINNLPKDGRKKKFKKRESYVTSDKMDKPLAKEVRKVKNIPITVSSC
jgi:hypothetical protein